MFSLRKASKPWLDDNNGGMLYGCCCPRMVGIREAAPPSGAAGPDRWPVRRSESCITVRLKRWTAWRAGRKGLAASLTLNDEFVGDCIVRESIPFATSGPRRRRESPRSREVFCNVIYQQYRIGYIAYFSTYELCSHVTAVLTNRVRYRPPVVMSNFVRHRKHLRSSIFKVVRPRHGARAERSRENKTNKQFNTVQTPSGRRAESAARCASTPMSYAPTPFASNTSARHLSPSTSMPIQGSRDQETKRRERLVSGRMRVQFVRVTLKPLPLATENGARHIRDGFCLQLVSSKL